MASNQMTNSVSGEKLRSYIERWERLEQERKALGEDQKLVMQEAKAAGFDAKIVRHCIKVRKLGSADYHEAQALADMYLAALGMVVEPPLFRAANMIGVDTAAKESVVEALKRFVPDNGSIVIEAGGVPVRLTRDRDGNVSAADIVHQPAPDPDATARPGGGGDAHAANAAAAGCRRRAGGSARRGSGQEQCADHQKSVSLRRSAPGALGRRMAPRRRQ